MTDECETNIILIKSLLVYDKFFYRNFHFKKKESYQMATLFKIDIIITYLISTSFNSTLLFNALPAAVLLSPIGFSCPYPFADKRLASIPFFLK